MPTDAGPLPVTWRNFIALMASARHACVYLVRRQQDAFLANGACAQRALQAGECNAGDAAAARQLVEEIDALESSDVGRGHSLHATGRILLVA